MYAPRVGFGTRARRINYGCPCSSSGALFCTVGKGEELADVEQGAADGLGDSDSAEEGKWGASWFDQVG